MSAQPTTDAPAKADAPAVPRAPRVKTEHKCISEGCEKVFHKLSNMYRHVARMHPDQAVKTELEKCPECKKELYSSRGLASHIRQVHSPEAIAAAKKRSAAAAAAAGGAGGADGAAAGGKDKKEGRNSRRRRTRKPPVAGDNTKPAAAAAAAADKPKQERKCPQCDKSFNKKANMIRHIKLRHPEAPDASDASTNEATFVCDECKRVLSSEQGLRRHQSQHVRDAAAKKDAASDNKKPAAAAAAAAAVACADCSKTFPTERRLERHRVEAHKPSDKK